MSATEPTDSEPPFPDPPESVRLRTSDGVDLHVARYREEVARAVVIACHGIQSHASWFDASSRQIAAAGYEVWFADRRGSGRSGGERGHARGGERLLRDLDLVIDAAKSALPGCPVVLLGVCWGGKLTVAAAARRDDVSGLGLLYPALFPRAGRSPWSWLLLKGAKLIGVQRRPTSLPLPPELFTSDPARQQDIREDPLALRDVSVGLVQSGLELDRLRRPASVACLVFCGLAGGDRVIRNAPLRRWLAKLPTAADVRLYREARHVLEFEASRQTSTGDFVTWLDRLFDR